MHPAAMLQPREPDPLIEEQALDHITDTYIIKTICLNQGVLGSPSVSSETAYLLYSRKASSPAPAPDPVRHLACAMLRGSEDLVEGSQTGSATKGASKNRAA